MTDRSLPVGDRDDATPPTGPARVRAALRSTAPIATAPIATSSRTFAEQVVQLAREQGWDVIDARPQFAFVRGGVMIVAHIGPVTGFQVDQRLHRLRQVRTVVSAHWRPTDGLGPVRDALAREAS